MSTTAPHHHHHPPRTLAPIGGTPLPPTHTLLSASNSSSSMARSVPNEADCWLALLNCGPIERVRHPKELKEEMAVYLGTKFDMRDSRIDFTDFGILWIDPHYRELTTKMARTGPGYEMFQISTYRIMKTSRLEGYWDAKLSNIADWIKKFSGEYRSKVTVQDFERLLDAMPGSRDLETYKQNLGRLFWGKAGADKGNNRSQDLLIAFPSKSYDKAYAALVQYPPDEGWEIRELMYQITSRGILGKSIMLHVGLWFHPELEEPANRANHKHPMIDHLKPAFSRYEPNNPQYKEDESWKETVVPLQRVILDYTIDQWPKGMTVMGKLETIQRLSSKDYNELLEHPFWQGLIAEIRKYTKVLFRHPVLLKHNTGEREIIQLPTTSWTAVPRRVVTEAITSTHDDDDSDLSPLSSITGDSTIEERSQGKKPPRRSMSGSASASAKSDALDYIVVGSNAVEGSGQPKRKRAFTVKEEADENLNAIQHKRRTPSTGLGPHQTNSKGSSPNLRSSLPIHPANDDIPINTIVSSARAALANLNPGPFAETSSQGPGPYVETKTKDPLRPAPSVLRSQPHEAVSWENEENDLTPSDRLRRQRVPPPLQQPGPVPSQQIPPQQHQHQTTHYYSASMQHPSQISPYGPQDNAAPHHHPGAPNHAPPKPYYYQPSPTQPGFPPHPGQYPPPPPHSQYAAPHGQLDSQHRPSYPQQQQPPQSDSMPVTPQQADSPLPPGRSKIEHAIFVLQEQYGDKLQIKEMLAAIKLLKNEVDATVFLTLKPGRLRNAWLANEIK